jgi:hypothetical protein
VHLLVISVFCKYWLVFGLFNDAFQLVNIGLLVRLCFVKTYCCVLATVVFKLTLKLFQ